jgi:hypothetical protein
MKIKELLRCICCIIGLIACAGNKNHSKKDQMANVAVDSSYKVAVAFGSRCCGTASSEFLGKFLKDFNRTAAVKVSADIAEGCGREGEFYILFKVMIEKRGMEWNERNDLKEFFYFLFFN